MAYTIKKTDGTTLLTLADGKVDQLSSSLALLGRNVNSYGEYYNDNLIGLLENFASTDEPRSPIHGQLWYNKLDGRMYVYSVGNTFKQITGTIVSPTAPAIDNTRAGDIWIDSENNQLYFSADGNNFLLAGPPSNEFTTKNGWIIESVIELNSTPEITRLVASIYSDDILIGIASPVGFEFKSPVGGVLAMTSVQPGFNLNTGISGIRFVGTATSADSVIGYSPLDYLRRDTNETTTGVFSFRNNAGINLGQLDDISVGVDVDKAMLQVNTINMDLKINLKSSDPAYITPDYSALHFDSFNRRIGVFTSVPSVPFEVQGDALINGNLTVLGGTTFVESSNLRIADKNIELAYGGTSLDTIADGGGITLHGSTDHTISWINDFSGWNVNDNFNLPVTNSYKIGNETVMTATSIGSVITSAPGVTSVGVLTFLTVTNVMIWDDIVSATGTNQTLHLTGSGTGTVDVLDNRITSLATPTNNTDAANKGYVDTAITVIGARSAVVTIDTTGMTDPIQEIVPLLNGLFPISGNADPAFDLPDGVRIKVLATKSLFVIPEQILDIRTSTVQVDQNGNQSAVAVLFDAAGVLPRIETGVGATPISYTVERLIYTYLSILGEWVYQP